MRPFFLSVICPVYNEEKFIEKCIESILLQDFPKENLEVLFLDGMSQDQTRPIIQSYIHQYSFIKLLNNPKKIVPTALNIGIKAAKGDVIIRLDSHAIYPINYFSILTTKLFELQADNVGCACRTLPPNESAIGQAIASALSCSFGMGNSHFRIGVQEVKKVDTVPFGCFNRSIFEKIGFFNEDLIRNQDDEFNGRIIKNGGTIYLIPDISFDYFCRDSISKTSKMFYQYGLYKPLVNKKLGHPATLRQFFPVLFLSGIIIGGILSLFSKIISIIYAVVLSIYFLIGVCIGINFGLKHKKASLFLLMPLTFFIIHVSYGWGYLIGLFKIFFKQKFNVEVNH